MAVISSCLLDPEKLN